LYLSQARPWISNAISRALFVCSVSLVEISWFYWYTSFTTY
jgi:hypothetical protein